MEIKSFVQVLGNFRGSSVSQRLARNIYQRIRSAHKARQVEDICALTVLAGDISPAVFDIGRGIIAQTSGQRRHNTGRWKWKPRVRRSCCTEAFQGNISKLDSGFSWLTVTWRHNMWTSPQTKAKALHQYIKTALSSRDFQLLDLDPPVPEPMFELDKTTFKRCSKHVKDIDAVRKSEKKLYSLVAKLLTEISRFIRHKQVNKPLTFALTSNDSLIMFIAQENHVQDADDGGDQARHCRCWGNRWRSYRLSAEGCPPRLAFVIALVLAHVCWQNNGSRDSWPEENGPSCWTAELCLVYSP